MKLFEKQELQEAIAHSEQGGQALYLDGDTGRFFDQDRDRLAFDASLLGTRNAGIVREGTNKQHMVLCGRALERAIAYTRILEKYQNQSKETRIDATLKEDEVTILLSNDKYGRSIIVSEPVPPLDVGE